MTLYQNHSNRELEAVLEQSHKLTYAAKLDLQEEFRLRKLPMGQSNLEDQVKATETAIAEMAYLKDMGFQYSEDSTTGRMYIKRAFMAQVMDIVSIVMGTLLFIVGLLYFWMLMAMFFGDNPFSLGKLMGHGLLVAAGVLGFRMLSGINRFLDYYNFGLTKTGDTIQLTKHPNGNNLTFTSEDVHTELDSNTMILKVGDIEIVQASASNLVQKRTLEELKRKLTN